jgi:ketosteroid isomerase-like protein
VNALLRISFVTLASACAAGPAPPNARRAVAPTDIVITGPQPDARAILAARDTLNRGLRDRDVRPFAHFWLENVVITGGNGASRIGRDSSVRAFTRSFSDSSFVSGVRTPERVDVGIASDGRGQAAEAGRWVWRARGAQGVSEAEGRYLVFWRRTDEGWRIRSELYVTTACVAGPGCGPAR